MGYLHLSYVLAQTSERRPSRNDRWAAEEQAAAVKRMEERKRPVSDNTGQTMLNTALVTYAISSGGGAGRSEIKPGDEGTSSWSSDSTDSSSSSDSSSGGSE